MISPRTARMVSRGWNFRMTMTSMKRHSILVLKGKFFEKIIMLLLLLRCRVGREEIFVTSLRKTRRKMVGHGHRPSSPQAGAGAAHSACCTSSINAYILFLPCHLILDLTDLNPLDLTQSRTTDSPLRMFSSRTRHVSHTRMMIWSLCQGISISLSVKLIFPPAWQGTSS